MKIIIFNIILIIAATIISIKPEWANKKNTYTHPEFPGEPNIHIPFAQGYRPCQQTECKLVLNNK